MEKTEPIVSASPRRRAGTIRLRTAAAGSLLAAASAAGIGVVGAAPARAEQSLPASMPAATPCAGDGRRAEACGRLAGVRAELANAVGWGMVTQAQADGFYARIQHRIERELRAVSALESGAAGLDS